MKKKKPTKLKTQFQFEINFSTELFSGRACDTSIKNQKVFDQDPLSRRRHSPNGVQWLDKMRMHKLRAVLGVDTKIDPPLGHTN